ncbi:MAG TPA: glycosyltransferase family A protein [Microvirga sp.]|jgi:hypothetical protein
MRIAVITAYCRETLGQLERCHASVRGQMLHCDHFLVSDGYPRPEVDGWTCRHLKIPNHNDFGDTPRIVGAASAIGLGYDAVAFLDADNWYEPQHLLTLVMLQRRTGAHVVTAGRMLRRAQDGSLLGPCRESDGESFNDTNCYLITRPAFGILRAWAFLDKATAAVGDRIFWHAVKEHGIPRAHSPQPTVNYVTNFASHYVQHGEAPPADSKMIIQGEDGAWRSVSLPDYLAWREAQARKSQAA